VLVSLAPLASARSVTRIPETFVPIAACCDEGAEGDGVRTDTMKPASKARHSLEEGGAANGSSEPVFTSLLRPRTWLKWGESGLLLHTKAHSNASRKRTFKPGEFRWQIPTARRRPSA
jgi:hypothetical protein